MKCPRCGAAIVAGQTFCGSCGAVLQWQQPAGSPGQASSIPQPQSSRLLIICAVIAGLFVGGIVVWRSVGFGRQQPNAQQSNTKNSPATVPNEHEAPSVVTPAEPVPKAPSKRGLTKASRDRTAREQAAYTPPVLLTQQPAPTAEPPQVALPSEASGTEMTPKRKAVQETTMENPPMPSTAPQAGAGATKAESEAPSRAVPAPVAPARSAEPQPNIAPTPAYTGPSSGTLVWTGKLDKGQTLTITGNNASTGSLSGQPLPGVPVRLTVLQSNLGFDDRPNSANGYRGVSLKSHGKHDRITIQWEVLR
ncbi:MAG: zinc-ribbon domain-containing protein [Acidobacteriaceae bacterium]|nr:zinc-ribbon domain-containing protein [Acidobacteriaceae bacterium]